MKKCILSFLAMSLCFSLGAQTLSVSSSANVKVFAPLVLKVLEEASFTVTYTELPNERSLQSVNSGEIDVEFLRSEYAITGMPNVVKINVPLATEDFVAMTLDSTIKISSAEDLKKYTVGYARGNRTCENIVKKAGVKADIAQDEANLMVMLKAKRFQVALLTKSIIPSIAKDAGITGYVIQQPALERIPLYIIINKKNAQYLPRMEPAFKKWVDSGKWSAEVQKIFTTVNK